MTPKYWTGKKVFVTGSTGFKGAWLCLLLDAMGANIYGYSDAHPTTPSLYQLAKVHEIVTEAWGDVRNFESLEKSLAVANPSHVIHMAAQAIVKKGFSNPLETFDINTMGTATVLQACAKNPNVNTVLVVTTDKVYGEHNSVWGYRESDPIAAADPYSTSKACVELVTACFRDNFMQKYGKKVATARAGNVIGGGDFAYRVVPMTMESILKDETPKIWDPSAIRPWQSVLDCLNGYLTLMEYADKDPKNYAGAWNFGPGVTNCESVGGIIDKLIALWCGGDVTWKRVDCPDTYHLNIALKLDSQKANTLLGWQPKWGLEQTLTNIVEWYRWYQKGDNIREICERTIDQYGL